jgi:hypothetical protein
MMRTLALAIRFLLELCILASFAAWATWLQVPPLARIAIAVFACTGVATLWGMFLSPKRRVDLPGPVRLAIEASIFLTAAAALWQIDLTGWGVALLCAAVADRILLALPA